LQTRQPIQNIVPAAKIKIGAPQTVAINQANGRAANDPQVPGATRDKPLPNHVAINIAGCHFDKV